MPSTEIAHTAITNTKIWIQLQERTLPEGESSLRQQGGFPMLGSDCRSYDPVHPKTA